MPRRRIPNDPARQAKKRVQKITGPEELFGLLHKLTREELEKVAQKGPVKRWEKRT
jgi:hypothetical protein